jgi:hypothetical protein
VNRPAEGSFWPATVLVAFGLLATRWLTTTKESIFHLESGIVRKRQQAIRAGCRSLGTSTTAAWHYRSGTCGPPSVLETYWHEWCPARNDRVWQQINGRWTVRRHNINHRITHNGDFDRPSAT